MSIRKAAFLMEDSDDIEGTFYVKEKKSRSLFTKGYDKFSQSMLDITSYEYMERGLILGIGEINEKWKELTFIERLKYNLIR